MSDDDRVMDESERRIAEEIAAWYAAPLDGDVVGQARGVVQAVPAAERPLSRMPKRWVSGLLAAAVVLAAVLARVLVTARAAPAPVSVRFVLRAVPTATRVTLVGDFNGWNIAATPLGRGSSGAVWTVDVRMAPGRYGYAFVVDGREWIADPTAPLAPDAFGNPTSVIVVGGAT